MTQLCSTLAIGQNQAVSGWIQVKIYINLWQLLMLNQPRLDQMSTYSFNGFMNVTIITIKWLTYISPKRLPINFSENVKT